jgi:murein DD-endopeptidase MepM/ murein hydrolase activator NlpD
MTVFRPPRGAVSQALVRALPLLAAYAWPLDAPPALTSSYGEFRAQHFHGGLDLSTGGRVGVPVYAVADGTVTRVRASGVGYGRSVYLELADGRTAVYAHLDAFEPELAAWVAAVQESTARYEQDLVPPAGRFRYRKGQRIGASGESGAGPPHLHVELRAGVVGLNPLRHGLAVADREAPVVEALWVSPASASALVERAFLPRRFEARGRGSRFDLASPVRVWGPVRLALQARDTHDDGSAALGLYRVEAWLDGEPFYAARIDSVSWLETREVKVIFDYEARSARRGTRRAYALYAPPGLRAGVAEYSVGQIDGGMGPHRLSVRCEDAAGNTARFEAELLWEPPPAAVAPPPPGGGEELLALRRGALVLRPYGLDGGERGMIRTLDGEGSVAYEIPETFRGRLAAARPGREELRLEIGRAEPGWKSVLASEDRRFALEVGPDAAFEAHPLGVETLPPSGAAFDWGETVSARYRVLPEALPWREAVGVEMAFRPAVPERAGIFLLGEEGPILVGAEAGDSTLRGRTTELGTFVAVRDTVAPEIGGPEVRGPRGRARPSESLRVRWEVRDRGAGFGPDEVRLWVDGAAVPVEYDVDAARAVWRPYRPPPPGTRAYRLEVTDRLGNRSVREGRFTHR